MSINFGTVSCHPDCTYAGKEIPRHMPTPTCRLFAKYSRETNPVTKSVYRDIINRRLQCTERKELKDER